MIKQFTLLLGFWLKSFALFSQYDVLLDSTFSEDGIVSFPYVTTTENGVFLQSDGKILLMAEQKIAFDSAKFTVLRLEENGMLDTTYNHSGISDSSNLLSVGSSFDPIGLLLNNNDLLVAGSGYSTPWKSRSIVIHKYLEDGRIDTHFGKNGSVILTEDSLLLGCRDMIAFNDSSFLILIGGDFFGVNSYIKRNILYKIKNNGKIDSSFAFNGRLSIPLFKLNYPYKMALSEDESLYLLGETSLGVSRKVVKINPDLSLEDVFVYQNNDTNFYDAEIFTDEDGKIILGTSEYRTKFKLWRLMPNGDLDISFNKEGVLEDYIHIPTNGLGRIIQLTDGKLLISLNGGAMAMRVNPNGTLDYSFDLDGISEIVPYNSVTTKSSGLALQPDGKIIFMTGIQSGTIKIIRVKTRP